MSSPRPSIRKSGKQRPIAKRGSEVKNPCNALHYACLEGNAILVSNLLQKASYDVDTRGEGGFTALHFASNVGALGICLQLLEAKADPNVKTDAGFTAHQLIMSHDYTSKPLYRQVMHFLENNEDMDFTDNTKKEIPESVVPVNRTKSTHDSHATRLQRTPINRTPSRTKFSKSISTGDLLRSMKKDEIEVSLKKKRSVTSQKVFHSTVNITALPTVVSESDSTSESTKLRSNIKNLLQQRSDFDTGSSEFGEVAMFIEPRDIDTEYEQSTPKGGQCLEHPHMDSYTLRRLTSNVFDVMMLINGNELMATHINDAQSSCSQLLPTSLTYEEPTLISSSKVLTKVSIPRLLKKILSVKGKVFYHEFLILHRFFLSPEGMHKLLSTKFKSTEGPSRNLFKNRLKILELYENWITRYFPDIQLCSSLVEDILSFIDEIPLIDKAFELRDEPNTLKNQILARRGKLRITFPISMKVRLVNSNNLTIPSIPVDKLAEELTLTYKELLNRVNPLELSLFHNNQEIVIYANVVVQIYELNDILKRWIFTEILTSFDNQKSFIISFFVDLLERCLYLRNYQVPCLIAQVLLSQEIMQLENVWINIPEKKIGCLKNTLNAFTRSMNYELFAYYTFNEKKPIVYDIEIILNEFIKNSSMEKNRFNFQKLRILSKFLTTAASYNYDFESVAPLKEFILELQPLSSKLISVFSQSYTLSADLTLSTKSKSVQFYHNDVLCQVDHGKLSAKSGRVEDFISIILDEDIGSISYPLIEELCLTHHHYIKSVHLLELLLQRLELPNMSYFTPSEKQLMWKRVSISRERIFQVIRLWFGEFAREELMKDITIAPAIRRFLKNSELLSYDETFFFTSILRSFKLASIASQQLRKSMLASRKISLSLSPWTHETLLKSSFPKTAAKQLCLIDFGKYSKIPPSEFLGHGENNDETRLGDWATRFNQVSNWVSSCIMRVPDLNSRIKLIKQFIRVARECLGHQNFNSSYAIVTGLNQSSVQRLAKTWEGVSPTVLEQFHELEKVFDYRGGYRTYRHALKKMKPPVIPFLGVFTKDIYLLHEHNSTFNDDGNVNFEKFSLLVKIIRNLISYQKVPYDFEVDLAAQHYLEDLDQGMDEDLLFETSIKIEPRKQNVQKNPVFGQVLVSPRSLNQKKESDNIFHSQQTMNIQGEKVTKVTNPIFSHPKLSRSKSATTGKIITQSNSGTTSEPKRDLVNNLIRAPSRLVRRHKN